MKLLIQAANIHGGGGRTLLRSALEGVPVEQPCVVLTDTRLDDADAPAHVTIETFAPTLASRFRAEQRLQTLSRPGDVVLCLGNLPPLLSNAAKVYVYLGNRYLCDKPPGAGFSWSQRARIHAERAWLRRRLLPSMHLLVQTSSMQQAVRASLHRDATILPFFSPPVPGPPRLPDDGVARFLYPASGEPHKNHVTLLEAWQLLAQSQLDCELHLTVSRSSRVAELIDAAKRKGVKVVNHGAVDQAGMDQLYAASRALIFPSDFESFGLPLLEARAAGLPIVAAERDYVRDVVVPAETFDPTSPVSIARAVARLLGTSEAPAPPLTPQVFVSRLLDADA